MNQETESFFDSKSPEQKLHTLTAELRTPVEIIRGCAETIRLTNLSQKIKPEGMLINAISEAADKIKNLLDEMVRSKGFYTPSHDLSSTDILLGLRQHLLQARQEDDKETLQSLAIFFDMLWEIAAKKKIQGIIFGILQDLERSAWDSIGGVPWKSTIPSEEEIISALNTNV
jgi:signal transduction histidine kinase